MIYEVTIPFKKGPWYTVVCQVSTAHIAIKEALLMAHREGLVGAHGKPTVRKIEKEVTA